MCEMKTVLVSFCLILLVTASFCMYWVYAEKKVGQKSEIKIQNPCEKEYKKNWLNGGECYYLIDEDIVGCNGFMEENVVTDSCGGLRWDFKLNCFFTNSNAFQNF